MVDTVILKLFVQVTKPVYSRLGRLDVSSQVR